MKVLAPAAVAVALIGLLAGPVLAQERGRADTASQSAKERRIALVIGNGQYKMGALRNPVNDARAIAKALGQTGFSVSLVENAGKAAMRRVIRNFGEELKKGGIGLFYFAGHGIQIGDRNFLIPVSAQIESADDIEDESVDTDLLLRQMDTAQNPLNIVILDACRNNPFPRGSRSSAVGLAEMRAPTGTLVAFATAPGSVSSDGEGANGVYAKHLVDALARPGLTIEQVFKQVRVNVTQDTKNLQVPWESSSLTGDFYFRPLVAVAAPGASPNLEQTMVAAIQRAEERGRTERDAQQRQMDEAIRAALERQAQQFLAQQKEAGNAERARLESAFWESVKGSADVNDFKAYLDRYPDGTFAALAKNRIATLSRGAQPAPQAGAAASAAPPARPATPMAPAAQAAQPAVPAPRPIQIAAARPTSQAVPAELKGLPKAGDSWTYALMDLKYKPNDRSQLYTHTVTAVAENSILESIRKGRTELGDFAFSNEMMGIYRGGLIVETMPYAHVFSQLKTGDRWGQLKIYRTESISIPNAGGRSPFLLDRGEVAGVEKITVPAGTFDAIKVRFTGSVFSGVIATYTVGFYSQFTQTVWYAPAVKRVAKVLVEGFNFTEAYELQSYALQ